MNGTPPVPQHLANTAELAAAPAGEGAIWKLQPERRDLDANVIRLAAGDGIGEHAGPELDVLLHVISGSGTLDSDETSLQLSAGDLVYLPARTRRRIQAGGQGLVYFSVHQRKRTTGLMPGLRPGAGD